MRLPMWKSGHVLDDFYVDMSSKYMRKFGLDTDARSFWACGNRVLNDDSALFASPSASEWLLRKRGIPMKISTIGYGKERRFTELVLYISSKLSNDEFLGGVKLNKVLY